jgi:glycosyltransferase involved in cell wall biosynthesis
VLALVDNDRRSDGCSAWRIWQPFAELQRRGLVAEWGWNDDDRVAMMTPRFDAVVMPRLTWSIEQQDIARQWVELLHSRGQVMISEWDDDAFGDEIVKRNVMFRNVETQQEAEAQREMGRFVLQLADGVTVTNQHLAAMARRYTDKPVCVVPNSIDLDWWRQVLATAGPRVVPSPTIGWAGGQRPDRDVTAMAIAWGRVAKRRTDVTFVIIGWQPDVIAEHVPENRIVRLQWLPVGEYPINFVNIDIGCCPLSSESFNRSKSAIKAYEYAAAGAAVVASPRPYKQVVQHGETGYIAETADEWEAALVALLESPNRRKRMAQNLVHRVEWDHSLRINWYKWPLAWTEIVDEFKERNHARRQSSVLIASA